MAKEKKEKKPKSKLRKALEWVGTGIFALIFIMVAVFQISSARSKKDNHGVANFNGMQTLVVLTDSMEPEYMVKEAVFVKKVDPSEIEEGDDITFYYKPWSNYMSNPIVTHRCLKKEFDATKPVGEQYTFTVHGINTDSDNCHQTGGNRDCTDQTQSFHEDAVLGIVVGSSKFVGGIYSFISSPFGLLGLLLIPCLYLVVTSVLDIFKAIKDPEEETADVVDTQNPIDNDTKTLSNECGQDSLAGLSEEDKKRLKEELLNQMLGGDDK